MRRLALVLPLMCLLVTSACHREPFIDQLLSQMTLEEKRGQLNVVSIDDPLDSTIDALGKGMVGTLWNASSSEEINRLQKIAVEGSRLGIPVLFGRDISHGYKTIFPIPLGMAATFDSALVQECTRIAKDEAVATGILCDSLPHTPAKTLSKKALDQAVRQVLRTKVELGLFESPYVDADKATQIYYAPQHLAAAKKAALKSAVLLKNNGILPLRTASLKTLVVTGSMAQAPLSQLGTQAPDGDSAFTITPLEALQSRYSHQMRIVYEPSLDKAVEAARYAQVVLAVVGDTPEERSALLPALHHTQKPVVAVAMAHHPLDLENDLPQCDALLFTFQPGTQGGDALVDLLFGNEVPSGKLPISLPRKGNQAPLFPFGFGRSYTTFAYTNLQLATVQYGATDTLSVCVDLTNTGTVDATEVPQLYLRPAVSSLSPSDSMDIRSSEELRSFTRVFLEAGQTRTVTMRLPLHNITPGKYQLWIAPDSATGEPVSFEIEAAG